MVESSALADKRFPLWISLLHYTAGCAFLMAMTEDYRHPVGKQTLTGYIGVRPKEKSFFGPDPGLKGREIEICFGEGQKTTARYYRTSGKEHKLMIAYTGADCEEFRGYLRRNFRMRRARKPGGVLVFTRSGPDRYTIGTQTLRQATTEVLELGARRYFEGARPISVLHPGLMGFAELFQDQPVPETITVRKLRGQLRRILERGGWEQAPSVGGGLTLPGGLRRAGAQLHEVLQANDLFASLLSVATAFELASIDLGVLLVADGGLASRLKGAEGDTPASLDRAVRNIRQLTFLLRGPVCMITLASRKVVR